MKKSRHFLTWQHDKQERQTERTKNVVNVTSQGQKKHFGIFCELCETWYHAACEGICENIYQVLNNP